MSNDTFAGRLRKEIDPLQERLMYHPLNQAIFNGTLPVPVRREYAIVAMDGIYRRFGAL